MDAGGKGTYTIAWRALSEDNHNLERPFVFHVGTSTGAAQIDGTDGQVGDAIGAVGACWPLGGMLALFGTAVIQLLNGAEDAVVARLRLLALAAGAVGALGTLLILGRSAAATSGRPVLEAIRFIPDLATNSRTGRPRGDPRAGPRRRRHRRASVEGVAVQRVARPRRRHRRHGPARLIGYAWTSDQRGLALASDVGHQIAAGTWVGGAAALLVALRATSAPSRLAHRFSTAAMVGAVVIAATGTASALINTGSWDAVASTGYGRLVIAKVVGFAILVTFGWMNRRHLVPLVERTAAPLLRSVRWEIVAAVGVLAVTAVLIDQPPGRSSVDRPFNSYETSDEVMVQLTVQPARAGTNDMHLYFYDAATSAQLPVDAVELTAATDGIPARRLDLVPVTSSHASALGTSLPAPGTWTVEATVVRAGTPTTVTFEVPVR